MDVSYSDVIMYNPTDETHEKIVCKQIQWHAAQATQIRAITNTHKIIIVYSSIMFSADQTLGGLTIASGASDCRKTDSLKATRGGDTCS